MGSEMCIRDRQYIFQFTLDKMHPLWYEDLSESDKSSLAEWRQAWLDYPATGIMPNPAWHTVFTRAGTVFGYPTDADLNNGDTSVIVLDTDPIWQGETISFTTDGTIYTVTTVREEDNRITFTPAYSGETIPKFSRIYFR